METEIVKRHKKQLATMRSFLEGRRYFKALQAMELSRSAEEGFRKDGVTPKFHHQLAVTRLLTTLEPHFRFPEETFAASFLHDIIEDHGDTFTVSFLDQKFGQIVSAAVWKLTKKSLGLVKSTDSYFSDMWTCPIASLVKLSDRAYNLQTMGGVFTLDKQEKYVGEVHEWFYPMIRKARREFPDQYPAYENLKILLRCQVTLIEGMIALGRAKTSPVE